MMKIAKIKRPIILFKFWICKI